MVVHCVQMTPPGPDPAVSYTWDANRNVTNRGSDTFSWDYENQLTSATVNGTTTSFTYSGGLRQSRTVGTTTTTFTWDIAAGIPQVLDDGYHKIDPRGRQPYSQRSVYSRSSWSVDDARGAAPGMQR